MITSSRNGYLVEYSCFPLHPSLAFFSGEDLFHTSVMVGSLDVSLNASALP